MTEICTQADKVFLHASCEGVRYVYLRNCDSLSKPQLSRNRQDFCFLLRNGECGDFQGRRERRVHWGKTHALFKEKLPNPFLQSKCAVTVPCVPVPLEHIRKARRSLQAEKSKKSSCPLAILTRSRDVSHSPEVCIAEKGMVTHHIRGTVRDGAQA